MVAGALVALGAVLASALPRSFAAETVSAAYATNSLNVYRERTNGTIAVTGRKDGAENVNTASELVELVRNGYRHIIIRSHLDISDASELPGMGSDSLLVPPGHLAVVGCCDESDQAPQAGRQLLPNQCVLKMSGSTRFLLATDGHQHEILLQNVLILRQHESGEPRAAVSLYGGQLALLDTTIESNRYRSAPAVVMDSASAFITRTSFVGNAAPSGGAIGVVRSAVNLTDSFFHQNLADGVNIDSLQQGGAVWAQASVAAIQNCTFSENFAVGQGGALFFEGPTLATVSGTKFSENAANSSGSSVALSAATGSNTLLLSAPLFESLESSIKTDDDPTSTPTADIYVDGQSVHSVYVVNPKTNVTMMGPQGNTWPVQPTTDTPPLPPAQGFVQPKVLTGREAWIAAAQQVLNDASMVSDTVPTAQSPPPTMEEIRSRPWLFVCGIILASIAMLGIAGIIIRLCRQRVLKDQLPLLNRGKKKEKRSGDFDASRAAVVTVDSSIPEAGDQQQGSFLAWQAGDLPTSGRPPSPPRLLAMSGAEDRFGVGDGGATVAAAAAPLQPMHTRVSMAPIQPGRGGMRTTKLGAWARYRPATINEEGEDGSEALGVAMESGPEGPGGGHSGSAENLGASEGQGPTVQSDAMLPQIMAPSDSLPVITPGMGGLRGNAGMVSNPGASGSTVATVRGPIDGSATLSLREAPIGSSEASQGAPVPLMPQHSASHSVAFSHSLALSQSSALSSVRQGSVGGAASGGFTFARMFSSSSTLRAPTASLGAPMPDASDNAVTDQVDTQIAAEHSVASVAPHGDT